MRKEYDFSKATRNPYAGRVDPPSGPIRWARTTRFILLLSIVSAISLYGAASDGDVDGRMMILVLISYSTAVAALLLVRQKVRARGWRSLKEPPIIASLVFALPMIALAALVLLALLFGLIWLLLALLRAFLAP